MPEQPPCTYTGAVGFIPDDPEIAANGVDLAWPFALTPTGDLAEVAGEDNLVSALPLRACTRLGEIPHRPLYGVDFDEFMNAPSDSTALLQARLLEQYQREDRIASIAIDAVADPSGDTTVTLHAQVKSGVVLPPIGLALGGG